MADIKIEDSSSIASGDFANDKSKEWNVNLELNFLSAVARCKPVGIHKHFRIISIQRQFNRVSQTHYSLQDIRERLSAYYDMDALEELDKEDEEEAEEEAAAAAAADDGGENTMHEFSLPLDEYEQLISEHRQDDEAELSASPSPPPSTTTSTSTSKKARTGIKREASPMSSASATPTPEPEEGKPSSRRSTRRKSDSRKKTSGTKSSGSGGVGSSSSTNRRKRR